MKTSFAHLPQLKCWFDLCWSCNWKVKVHVTSRFIPMIMSTKQIMTKFLSLIIISILVELYMKGFKILAAHKTFLTDLITLSKLFNEPISVMNSIIIFSGIRRAIFQNNFNSIFYITPMSVIACTEYLQNTPKLKEFFFYLHYWLSNLGLALLYFWIR